ncbi:MAG: four helix bundle protein [Candidatus Marinimicrobia bacterium]|nr:four helix bundle protein [Candidatus Neomarinimicrobiota bacterium]
MEVIKCYRELRVYQKAFDVSIKIYDLSQGFPRDEIFSLTNQIRKSSRSVSANIAEAFRRRKYPKSFACKLNESEAEASETQNWLDYSLKHKYIDSETHQVLFREYENIIGMLVNMQRSSDKWKI